MSVSGALFELNISFGRDKYTVNASADMTWGDVLAKLAAMAGCDATSLRLLFKGKTADVEQTLSNAGLKNGTRLMAMKTKAQHAAEKQEETRLKLSGQSIAAEQLRSGAKGVGCAQHGAKSTAPKKLTLGDTIDRNTPYYVRIVQGSQWYNLILPQTGCVGSLKERLATLCGVSAKDQRLVFMGQRNFEDDAKLANIGAKRGSTFMLLASMRHHDMQEAKGDILRIEKEVSSLEEETAGLEKRVRGRLLNDFVDLSIAIGHLESAVLRLEDNVGSVRLSDESDGDRVCENLAKRLNNLEIAIASLREHASATFG